MGRLLLFLVVSSLTMVMIFPETAVCDKCSDEGGVVPMAPLVEFLECIQETALGSYGQEGFDPKLYVDLSLKQGRDLSSTVRAFEKLPRLENGSVAAEVLNAFLCEYLCGAAEDLVHVDPVDFVPDPPDFLPMVRSTEVRAWALKLHMLWKNLTRKVSDRVFQNPDSHTLLPLENPVIIPGSRFREVYYWDSYWVIRGLLASKMYETAKGIVYNLISLIEEFGYVLNGARAYYTNRSQPPLLSSMAVEIYKRTGDKDLVSKLLPALLKEYKFWNSGMNMIYRQ